MITQSIFERSVTILANAFDGSNANMQARCIARDDLKRWLAATMKFVNIPAHRERRATINALINDSILNERQTA